MQNEVEKLSGIYGPLILERQVNDFPIPACIVPRDSSSLNIVQSFGKLSLIFINHKQNENDLPLSLCMHRDLFEYFEFFQNFHFGT